MVAGLLIVRFGRGDRRGIGCVFAVCRSVRVDTEGDIDGDVGTDIDGQFFAVCLNRRFSRCRVVYTCCQRQVPP
ncbi:hypothetical protein BST11_05365 [Mycobacterium alsense]|uniref:Secreted protein n=1 Tax=Mycobacterium alsense TaxID=324058 RepID=A0ABX3RE71_9MYCO|nr:hypothetical protein BST11_05365 [Mycobacterium alsense]